jgi:hypothetical protein
VDVLSLKEKGFVYKWYDTSNDMYYIGCHKGHPDDGYIGSGRRFKFAYKKRPNSFYREILYYGYGFENYESIILDYLDVKNDPMSYNLMNSRPPNYRNEEQRKAASESKLGSKNPQWGKSGFEHHNSKPVYYKGVVYGSFSECTREIPIAVGTLQYRIKSDNFKDIYYMKNDFDVSDSFADFVDELTNDKKNDNAQCSLDNPECESCSG